MDSEHYGFETEQLCPESKCFGHLVRKPDGVLACPECGEVVPPEPEPWWKELISSLFDTGR